MTVTFNSLIVGWYSYWNLIRRYYDWNVYGGNTFIEILIYGHQASPSQKDNELVERVTTCHKCVQNGWKWKNFACDLQSWPAGYGDWAHLAQYRYGFTTDRQKLRQVDHKYNVYIGSAIKNWTLTLWSAFRTRWWLAHDHGRQLWCLIQYHYFWRASWIFEVWIAPR